MDAFRIKMRKWVAKVRFSKLVHHTNRNPSPFEDSTEYVKATFTLLHISRKGQNFVEIVLLAIELLSIQDPSTPGCLHHFLGKIKRRQPLTNQDATALPKAASLLQLNSRMIKICQKSHKNEVHDGRRAMCALVWSILASKLAGRSSSQLLTEQVVDILFDGIKCHHSVSTQIFSLIAIQSFITTCENKTKMINSGLAALLSALVNSAEEASEFSYKKSVKNDQRRLDFLRKVVSRRINLQPLQIESLVGLNCSLDWRLTDYNLDFSGDYLEVRNNLSCFTTVVGTHYVKKSKWYYEVELLTAGTIQIGWATSSSVFSTHNGVGVGDEPHSFSFDGSRMVCWFFQDTFSHGCTKWVPVGCYLNLSNWSAIFYINGRAISTPIQLPSDEMEVFINHEGGFKPAISLTVYEHVKVNFGGRPFKFSPPEGYYRDMNQYGTLDENFRAGPGSQLTGSGTNSGEPALSAEEEENMCQLCCTNEKSIVLLPCQHDGICKECVSKLSLCPFCREVVCSWHKSYNRALGQEVISSDTRHTATSSMTSFSLYHDANSTPTAPAPSAC